MCGKGKCLARILLALAAGLLIAVIFPGWFVAALLTAIAGITMSLLLCR